MLEIRRDLDLGQKAIGSEHGTQFRIQNLERDLPIMLEIAGQINRGHTAGADQMIDSISGAQRIGELFTNIHHWRLESDFMSPRQPVTICSTAGVKLLRWTMNLSPAGITSKRVPSPRKGSGVTSSLSIT